MLRFVVAALCASFVACSGCSGSALAPFGVGLPLPGIPLELDPTLAISTPNGGVGHACPVGGYVITAAHVLIDEETQRIVDVAWSDGRGNEGFATMLASHRALDIAVLEPEVEGLSYLPAGQAKVSDLVFWFEYDWRTQANVLRARRRFGRILRIVAQQIILDEVPIPGASGTCLINEAGQVVGIVNAAWNSDDGLGAGSAVKLPPLPAKEQ